MSNSSSSEPEGPLVTGPPAIHPSINTPDLIGTHVHLTPLSISHAPALFDCLGGAHNGYLYKYMHDSPYTDLAAYTATITSLTRNTASVVPFTILKDGVPMGTISYLNIVPGNRSLEIGFVMASAKLQRTTASTEAWYLMMRWAFENSYLRVEWKCNNFNEPSRRAALRLGFVHEGIFRKHMVIKGHSRDSWWSSVTDEEWFKAKEGEALSVRAALEAWLEDGNFDEEGKQKVKLEELRVGKK